MTDTVYKTFLFVFKSSSAHIRFLRNCLQLSKVFFIQMIEILKQLVYGVWGTSKCPERSIFSLCKFLNFELYTLRKFESSAQMLELCANFWTYFAQISELTLRKFLNLLFANFWILCKFLNFAQISEHCANFWTLRKFLNIAQMSELCTNFWTFCKFLNFS